MPWPASSQKQKTTRPHLRCERTCGSWGTAVPSACRCRPGTSKQAPLPLARFRSLFRTGSPSIRSRYELATYYVWPLSPAPVLSMLMKSVSSMHSASSAPRTWARRLANLHIYIYRYMYLYNHICNLFCSRLNTIVYTSIYIHIYIDTQRAQTPAAFLMPARRAAAYPRTCRIIMHVPHAGGSNTHKQTQ